MPRAVKLEQWRRDLLEYAHEYRDPATPLITSAGGLRVVRRTMWALDLDWRVDRLRDGAVRSIPSDIAESLAYDGMDAAWNRRAKETRLSIDSFPALLKRSGLTEDDVRAVKATPFAVKRYIAEVAKRVKQRNWEEAMDLLTEVLEVMPAKEDRDAE